MKKVLLLIAVAITMFGCVDDYKRLQNLQKKFPNHQVEPATGLIKNGGFQFILIDTNQQIIAVRYGEFSETRIASLRNIR
jgi:hypothetical protein